MRVPFSITKHTISFYARGRQWSIASGQPSFEHLRAALQVPQDQDHDVDALIGLVDVRQALLTKSNGEIVFIDEQIVWKGQPLHNVWVDKILDFRDRGEPYDPIWNALNRLMQNPTPAAIQRLPIFLERTGLGFLPDGRFIAFKGVAADLKSQHANLDGSYFTHEIGAKPRMDRDKVDADPDQTCSHGLHVGAQDYVQSFYSGGTVQIVLTAVAPEDVVAVPTDYQGSKMRVTGYEVIDHLDQSYSDELLGRLKTTVRGYEPPAPPAPPFDLDTVGVGDVVTYAGGDAAPAGEYEVLEVDDSADDEGRRLFVATSVGQVWLLNSFVTGVVAPVEEDEQEQDDLPWTDEIEVGHVVQLQSNQYAVVLGVSDNELRVRDVEGDEIDIPEVEHLETVQPDFLVASMFACIGAEVRIEGHPMIRDGLYFVTRTDEDGETQDDGDDAFFMIGDTEAPVTNGNIMGVTYRGTQLWPVVTTEVTVTEDAVHLRSLDGHDLRQDVVVVDGASGRVLQPGELVRYPEVGDLVEIDGLGHPPAGVYPAAEVCPTGFIAQTEHDGLCFVGFDRVVEVVSRPWTRAVIGGSVLLTEDQSSAVRTGWHQVVDTRPGQIQVRLPNGAGNWWVDADRVTHTATPA